METFTVTASAADFSVPWESATVSRIRNSGAVSSSWMKFRISRYCPERVTVVDSLPRVLS